MPRADKLEYWPAELTDIWYRHMLMGFKKTNGHIHRKELERLLRVQPKKRRPWQREVSGRSWSLGRRSIVPHAKIGETELKNSLLTKGMPPTGVGFRGLIAIKVDVARSFPVTDCDVIVEPIEGDDAHSNFVVYRSEDLDGIQVLSELSRCFQIIEVSAVDRFGKAGLQY